MDTIETFNSILNNFNIKATCFSMYQLDNYAYFDLKLQPRGKVKDIQKYSDEISLALRKNKPNIRILHDQGTIRMEFVSPRNDTLMLFKLFSDSISFDFANGLNCLLGQTMDGNKVWIDFLNSPHCLVAGTTGSGKSTLLHNIIANIFRYNNADLYLIDPKQIEFFLYENLRNTQVYYKYDDITDFIHNMITIMEDRYSKIRAGWNPMNLKPILIIIDEFADLVMQYKNDIFMNNLCQLAAKCRAARISIILSTQRPSVNIISGSIKANFPTRIACKVVNHVDSKVVLDSVGAENLLGKGDALLRNDVYQMERFQIAYTNASEVKKYFGS